MRRLRAFLLRLVDLFRRSPRERVLDRLAVGGERGDILRLVLTRGLRLVVLGAVLGLLSSLGTNRLLESQLWRTSPRDPGAMAAIIALITAVGLVACLVPALPAMRIEPMAALRQE